MPKVAISKDFLTAFSNLPKTEQKKMTDFTEKFRSDPTQSSINYEPVLSARDNKVRSVRIGRDYRAIVVHPPKGDVYLLVWVDHHDEAMDWARYKCFEVNSETGALQVYDDFIRPSGQDQYKNGSVLQHMSTRDSNQGKLFDCYKDDDLLLIGVPPILLPSIRAIITDSDLEKMGPHLPEEVYEGLYMLAAGYSLEQTVEELVGRSTTKVDSTNFAAALEHPDSKRRFALITSAGELTEALAAPLAQWRIFLHPNQERIVAGNYNGSFCVRGGAGTGKTVVAMHRARYLAHQSSDHRILFTTFTKNLSQSIKDNMTTLCSRSELTRIDIIHLHAWALRFMRSQGFNIKVATEANIHDCWHAAMRKLTTGFSEEFYCDEWEKIVQFYGIKTLNEYLQTNRLGRGTRIDRVERLKIWSVFEQYKAKLAEAGVVEWIDVIKKTREYIEHKNFAPFYETVIVDECQDFHPEELKLLRRIVAPGRNDLFLVGDAHQRIYGQRVALNQQGINIRGKRSRKLRMNYRTTEEIRRFGSQILKNQPIDDLDGGTETENSLHSLMHGESPTIKCFSSFEEECNFINNYIKQKLSLGVRPENICLVARTHKSIARYVKALNANGYETVLLDQCEFDEGDGVRLATMHRVKGLEFTDIIIVSANKGLVPLYWSLEQSGDSISRQEAETKEKSLLHVAITRARERLLITGYGELSPFLRQ